MINFNNGVHVYRNLGVQELFFVKMYTVVKQCTKWKHFIFYFIKFKKILNISNDEIKISLITNVRQEKLNFDLFKKGNEIFEITF